MFFRRRFVFVRCEFGRAFFETAFSFFHTLERVEPFPLALLCRFFNPEGLGFLMFVAHLNLMAL